MAANAPFSFSSGFTNGGRVMKKGHSGWSIDGMPSIKFSDRVHKLMEMSMAWTVVAKLLGRRIGLNALYNRIYALWKPQ
ncbi:hypothetical protein Golob_023117 [Gossypium lobatum]|uniref:Uncharacterized protein n=1 Tax=Gossypium lobatum TaxID=34289 RepID=A0A7J8LIM9_9ROSI|nr:hypothetical protein [Gossypium lobatum]